MLVRMLDTPARLESFLACPGPSLVMQRLAMVSFEDDREVNVRR